MAHHGIGPPGPAQHRGYVLGSLTMDWNSPITSKHIEEARARGCVLQGPGRNHAFRQYRLSCGHTQEITLTNMRFGAFRCRRCLADKLEREAQTQGCTLIGPGRSKAYREYRLSCGHVQEVTTQYMRNGTFKCRSCVGIQLAKEAASRGCEIIAPGRTANSRIYRLPCGHEQEISNKAIYRSSLHCHICQLSKLKAEAKVRGSSLLGSGRNAKYRRYRLQCGHELEVLTETMRLRPFRCMTCRAIYPVQAPDTDRSTFGNVLDRS